MTRMLKKRMGPRSETEMMLVLSIFNCGGIHEFSSIYTCVHAYTLYMYQMIFLHRQNVGMMDMGNMLVYFWAPLQTALKEYVTLKKFGDSLLNKSNKLNDLSAQLDEVIQAAEDSPHKTRVAKCLAQH